MKRNLRLVNSGNLVKSFVEAVEENTRESIGPTQDCGWRADGERTTPCGVKDTGQPMGHLYSNLTRETRGDHSKNLGPAAARGEPPAIQASELLLWEADAWECREGFVIVLLVPCDWAKGALIPATRAHI